MSYNIINLGNYDNNHVYRLLVDESLDSSTILQNLTNIAYKSYRQHLIDTNQLSKHFQVIQEEFDELSRLNDQLASKLEHWQSLEQPERGHFSATISNQYNHQIRLMIDRLISGPLRYYYYVPSLINSKVNWKTLNKHILTLDSIIAKIKDKPAVAIDNYANQTFELPEALGLIDFDIFIDSQPDINHANVQLIKSAEYEYDISYNHNVPRFHAPKIESVDSIDYI